MIAEANMSGEKHGGVDYAYGRELATAGLAVLEFRDMYLMRHPDSGKLDWISGPPLPEVTAKYKDYFELLESGGMIDLGSGVGIDLTTDEVSQYANYAAHMHAVVNMTQ